jgi:hypothetical protein
MVLTYTEKLPTEKQERKFGNDIQNSFVIAVVGGLLVYYKTQELGKLAIGIAVLSGIIIMLFSALLFLDDQT